MSEEQISQITDIFNLFDTDGGGTIDRRELSVAMMALGLRNNNLRGKQSRKASDALLDVIDSDKSNSLSLEEFIRLMKGELLMRDPLEEIKIVFAGICDLEASEPGVINLSKLRLASIRFNVRLSENELQMMVEQVDNDGNATIDLMEFIRVMTLSTWF